LGNAGVTELPRGLLASRKEEVSRRGGRGGTDPRKEEKKRSRSHPLQRDVEKGRGGTPVAIVETPKRSPMMNISSDQRGKGKKKEEKNFPKRNRSRRGKRKNRCDAEGWWGEKRQKETWINISSWVMMGHRRERRASGKPKLPKRRG